MLSLNAKLAAIGCAMGMTLLASNAHAVTEAMVQHKCEQLDETQLLLAIERGECEIDDIETAAGPQDNNNDGSADRTGRSGGRNSASGSSSGGGGGNSGRGNPNRP